MLKLFKTYEKFMIHILMGMMAIAIGLGTLDLGWEIFQDIMAPPVLLIDADQLLDIFSLFMLVIIGIELLETIMKTYLVEGKPHFEVVLSVAIIAIARKVIVLDLKKLDSLSLFGIAAIILSLTIGYYFMRRSHIEETQTIDQKKPEPQITEYTYPMTEDNFEASDFQEYKKD